MSKIEDDEFNNLKSYYKPANLSDVKSIVKKYGDDINDDRAFFIISFAVKYENDRECEKDLKEVSKDKIYDLFLSYHLDDFAKAYLNSKEKFEERYDSIRLTINSEQKENNLKIIIDRLKSEADKCHKASAFNAAAMLLASAIEGVLLQACRSNRILDNKIMVGEKESERVKSIEALTFSELVELCKLKKIFPFNGKSMLAEELLPLAKDVRNLVHPGRRLATGVHNYTELEADIFFYVYGVLQKHYFPS